MEKEVAETNAGVKKEGDIVEVAEFARKVEESLEDEVSKDSIQDFNDWRPREEDSEEDIRRKTVKSASISEKELEDKSEGLKDISEAGRKSLEAGRKALKRESPEEEVKEASKKAKRSVESGSRKAARKAEENIYSKIMTKLNPYFFDSKEFSADLRSGKGQKYSMEVNVPDKEIRKCLKDDLEDKDR